MAIKTPLYETHVALGGKIVDFAGFELPVQYQKGILFEHKTVREGVGLFDVSHMGEILIWGSNAAAAVQHLVTNRVSTMVDNQCRYTLMCYPDGSIVDDLLIYRIDADAYFLVVNAANTDKDFEYMSNNLLKGAHIKNLSPTIAQIAMQGPLSPKVLDKITDTSLIPEKSYHFVKDIYVSGIKCLISTTGYTGEVGYEFYCAAENAAELYQILLKAGEEYGIEPIGLGARDTLRFECAMPLYGHELTDKTKANEVGLDFFIKTDEDFIGRNAIVEHKPEYERRGLKLVDRGIAREHSDIYNENGEKIGMVTSGNFCPTIGGAYAMARVKIGLSDAPVYIDVRGRKIKAEWTELPFYKRK